MARPTNKDGVSEEVSDSILQKGEVNSIRSPDTPGHEDLTPDIPGNQRAEDNRRESYIPSRPGGTERVVFSYEFTQRYQQDPTAIYNLINMELYKKDRLREENKVLEARLAIAEQERDIAQEARDDY
ncbi:hypothetical protein ACJ73_10038 [Blastomyces percursus]|uniref:Uncharacterized protein n=1 Tax=Blastomyces percursus TaxID=1658174 RepID=A0A1J9P221_9EURO|nr:hypothetical protein ACJ73_10038 [Blastomyces percursus]